MREAIEDLALLEELEAGRRSLHQGEPGSDILAYQLTIRASAYDLLSHIEPDGFDRIKIAIDRELRAVAVSVYEDLEERQIDLSEISLLPPYEGKTDFGED
jgi:hypothetical protein